MTTSLPSSTRDRRRIRTRRELAASAVRLFEERGFAETTVEDIAEAADYSASTFFRMFSRKEDAAFHDMPDRLVALQADLDAAGDAPLWPTLRAALMAHAETWEEDDSDFAAARVRLFHLEPALASRYLEYCQDYELWIAELVTRRVGAEPLAAQLAGICIAGALRSAFRVQASSASAKTRLSVVDYLEDAFRLLEAGPLGALSGRR
ncbi:MAG TPA: TetR family transcriptional regulator [Nocardioidaceae bacterium]|nr:TetR family transcriptional regulator [Nocardioidaceae bacterium]